jgi:predicted anti-sigma-YlaC factor YlaD
MSSEHLTAAALEGYATRTLVPGELLLADRHLQICIECRERANDLKPMQEATTILSQVYGGESDLDIHLSYGELEALVDGRIDDVSREIVEVHTADCLSCREQLDDLKELRRSLEMPIRVEATTAAAGPGLWRRIANALTVRTALAAAALIAIIGFGLWVLSGPGDPVPVETASVDENIPPVSTDLSGDPNSNSLDTGSINEEPEPKTKSVVSLADGRNRLELDENGNLSGIDNERFNVLLKEVLRRQDIRVAPAARQLRSAAGALMGGESPGLPFALKSPVGRVIATDRPQFSWSPVAEAESYVVSVYEEGFTKVAESPELNGQSWTPAVRLKRGAVYNWQVTAKKAGIEIKSPVRPAPDAKFKVVDAASANDVEAARRTGSHLLLGTVYANAGMIAEAEREYQLLLKQNPSSQLVKKLLRQLQTQK